MHGCVPLPYLGMKAKHICRGETEVGAGQCFRCNRWGHAIFTSSSKFFAMGNLPFNSNLSSLAIPLAKAEMINKAKASLKAKFVLEYCPRCKHRWFALHLSRDGVCRQCHNADDRMLKGRFFFSTLVQLQCNSRRFDQVTRLRTRNAN